jgi:AcrR family transcriptional regulator
MKKTESQAGRKIITRNKPEKIKNLKKTTRNLIKQEGYLQVTNHGIARTAGVSIGLLYKYFPRGKPDILKSIVLDLNEIFQKDIPLITRSNWELVLKQLLKTFIELHKKNLELTKAMEIAMIADPTIFQDTRGAAQELMNIVPVIETLTDLGIISRKMTKEEIITNTTIIDQITHQYLFFQNLPVKNDDEFLDYLFRLSMKLFEINK